MCVRPHSVLALEAQRCETMLQIGSRASGRKAKREHQQCANANAKFECVNGPPRERVAHSTRASMWTPTIETSPATAASLRDPYYPRAPNTARQRRAASAGSPSGKWRAVAY
ncbi:hypothetical protein DFH06DRAFT_1118406 [Mycena polygramma]|nr:hypothetical protein DFH06DRAFT_1118406 [Mycena polygramma]